MFGRYKKDCRYQFDQQIDKYIVGKSNDTLFKINYNSLSAMNLKFINSSVLSSHASHIKAIRI